jgi:DNA repair exonuclease SbcCD nuclease subunit
MKIGIFTDFHWGVNKNSSEKVNVGRKVMREFAFEMEHDGVEEVIFMGDWNHSRDFIHVNTQEVAREALEEFASNFKHVHFIIGNHDCHYKDTNDVNSVEQFSRIPNVSVYKDYEEIDFGDKHFALCPWGTLPDPSSKIDAAFGHFEFSGAVLVGAVSSGPYTMDKLTAVTPLVFSGHFHIRKEYETNTGKVITAGCPYEQNWGDVGNAKGWYLLNTEDLSYVFNENVVSPRHIPVRWSTIKEFDTKQIANNYIRIIVDSDYEYDDVVKVMQAFHRAGARTVEPDYQFQKELSSIQETLGDANIMSHEEAINKYIDGMEINDEEKAWIRPIAIAMFNEASE